MNEILNIQNDSNFPIDGRELHAKLGIESNYTTWFKRMCEYGFSERTDFETRFPNLESEQHGGQNKSNHALTLSMAKEICMLQRTEMGRQIRRYLIEVEQAWNSPELTMARALKWADGRIGELTGEVKMLEGEIKKLEADNSRLAVENTVMAPKADYFDELVDRNLLTNFRTTAKQLNVPEKKFIKFLIDKKYVYRDAHGRLMPYAKKNDGLFEVKDGTNPKTGFAHHQTFITPKGKEVFRLLTEGM